jgi:hypothetical protein
VVLTSFDPGSPSSIGKRLARGTSSNPPPSPVKVTGGSVRSALNFDDAGEFTYVSTSFKKNSDFLFKVPIFDGRKGEFSMTELHKLGQVLKPWSQELTDCICLVGYTANTWTDNKACKHLSLNIQWVVVLASVL